MMRNLLVSEYLAILLLLGENNKVSRTRPGKAKMKGRMNGLVEKLLEGLSEEQINNITKGWLSRLSQHHFDEVNEAKKQRKIFG